MDQPHAKFRPMTLGDLPDIMRVEHASFTIPWTRQAFYNELVHNQFARYTVAQVDGKLIGYCGMWLIIDEAHITNIALLPEYRGKGIGKELLIYKMAEAKLSGAESMILEVRVSNIVAQRLYSSLGFEKKGIRPRYYTDNQEDAYIMGVTFPEMENGQGVDEMLTPKSHDSSM